MAGKHGVGERVAVETFGEQGIDLPPQRLAERVEENHFREIGTHGEIFDVRHEIPDFHRACIFPYAIISLPGVNAAQENRVGRGRVGRDHHANGIEHARKAAKLQCRGIFIERYAARGSY